MNKRTPMTEQELFVLAQKALKDVVDQIKDDQWEMVLPEPFSRRAKKELTLREQINYHAYDDAWVPLMLADKTMDEAGKDLFKGNLLGVNPKEAYDKYNAEATEAAQSFNDLEKTIHLSYGDYPAREYFWHIISFRTFRAYDLAKVIGIEPTTPTELLQGLWAIIEPHAEEWLKMGVIDAPLEIPEGADERTKVLAQLGRE